MTRRDCQPRANFQEKIRSQGLLYHTNSDGSPYWKEEVYYALTTREVDSLYSAAEELHQMFFQAADYILTQANGLEDLEIPRTLHDIIQASWKNEQWEFYGRFDLTFDSRGTPKLIEYNADTPTGILESSIIQWYWKNDKYPRCDQFNSIHEGLVNRWKELINRHQINQSPLYFTSVANHTEDRMTIGYLARTAEEAGISTKFIPIKQIGWKAKNNEFVDEQNQTIRQIFKLYPWEWLGIESFAPHLNCADWVVWEPPWKAIFASKKFLLTLQKLFPNHPNLLRVSEKPIGTNYVSKPVFGREGRNVTVYRNGLVVDRRTGAEKEESFIYQEYCSLYKAKKDCYAQLGVWMAGPDPVGLGIREDNRPILSNTSQFVPHVIE